MTFSEPGQDKVFFKAFFFSAIVFIALAADAPGHHFIVERDTEEGKISWTVQNKFYELVFSPCRGAVIKSFRPLLPGTYSTCSNEGDFSGLLQEVHTAELPYKITSKEIRDSEAEFTMSASTGHYRVEKNFSFSALSPFVTVGITFENHSEMPMRSDFAPALSNIFALCESQGKRPLYSIGGPAGTKKLTSDSLMRSFHSFNFFPHLPVRWIASCDPVTRTGAGMLFSHAGPERILASQNTQGLTAIETRLPALPAGSRLVSEILLVPIDGFSSLNLLTDALAAETLQTGSVEKGRLSIKLSALQEDMKDVVIVSRCYDSGGNEMAPLETVVFDRLQKGKVSEETIPFGVGPDWQPAWVQHEIYVSGRLTDRYQVSIAVSPQVSGMVEADPSEPVTGLLSAGEETREKTAQQPDNGGITVFLQSGLDWKQAGYAEANLPEESSQTLLFRLKASEQVNDLRISIIRTVSQNAEPETVRLGASNTFLWEVKNPDSPAAELVTLRKVDMEPGESVLVALTVNSSGLAPGAYRSKILLSSSSETIEIPLKVRVFPFRLGTADGFSFWHIGPSANKAVPSDLSNLSAASAYSASFGVRADSGKNRIEALQNAAKQHRISMLGFYSPMMESVYAERFAGWGIETGPPPEQSPLSWIVLMSGDMGKTVKAVEDSGFNPAVFVPRITPSGFEKIRENAYPGVLVLGGSEIPGWISSKIQGENPVVADIAEVWRHIDFSQYGFKELAQRARKEFYSASLLGFRGALVSTAASTDTATSGKNLLLWHILRDIREEAALLCLAAKADADPGDGETVFKLGDTVIRKITRPGAFEGTRKIDFKGLRCALNSQEIRRKALETLTE